MKHTLVIASLVVCAIFAMDAKACQGCCFDPPSYAAKCCEAPVGTADCKTQVIGGAPYCIRTGECEVEQCVAWYYEHLPLNIVTREQLRQNRFELVSVRIKRRYNARA